ncbi:hypothetical protein BKA65DRAFT_570376 [Rhexocercosporidium sp. MPI-PUGE-AT-0058]|nr:hypothetical protein BKA65DRAFT_570376 [Rhexocercosporidium sp. MPI-PUGE-AT-0058]
MDSGPPPIWTRRQHQDPPARLSSHEGKASAQRATPPAAAISTSQATAPQSTPQGQSSQSDSRSTARDVERPNSFKSRFSRFCRKIGFKTRSHHGRASPGVSEPTNSGNENPEEAHNANGAYSAMGGSSSNRQTDSIPANIQSKGKASKKPTSPQPKKPIFGSPVSPWSKVPIEDHMHYTCSRCGNMYDYDLWNMCSDDIEERDRSRVMRNGPCNHCVREGEECGTITILQRFRNQRLEREGYVRVDNAYWAKGGGVRAPWDKVRYGRCQYEVGTDGMADDAASLWKEVGGLFMLNTGVLPCSGVVSYNSERHSAEQEKRKQ